MPCVDCAADIETQDGDIVCETCARCDATVPEDETVETVRGSTICAPCRQDWYWQCQVCDGWNHNDDGCGNGCCDPDDCDCDDYREHDCAKIACSYLGSLGYLKLDSSIGNGFEIVTHPMSSEWAMANFPWQMLTRLRDAGCEATDNTGIHV